MRALDIPATAARLSAFIRASVRDAGFSKVVVAVSGGVDSAAAVSLAVDALGRDNVSALLLPYRDWHTDAMRRAHLLLERLGVPASQTLTVDIALLIDAFLAPLGLQPPTAGDQPSDPAERARLGNIMARTRMIVLFDAARKLSSLVVGTENKSEHYLGYYTRFGDEASDIEPLRNLYKTEVYLLARHLGVPQDILDATPTAGLWAGQTDEGEFGFTYQAADEILHGLVDTGLTANDLVERGLDKATVDSVQAWVERMAFKHHLPMLAPEPVSGK